MRLTKEQSEKNQQSILDAASRLFRLRGVEAVSVADVMHECGFTIGGFYRRFASKEELVIEAVRAAFRTVSAFISNGMAQSGGGRNGLDAAIANYLSEFHRDSGDGGCPASALPCDAARAGPNVQAAYADGIETYLQIFGAEMDGSGSDREKRERAIGLLSNMVGALVLSRAVAKSDAGLSEEILAAAKSHINGTLAKS